MKKVGAEKALAPETLYLLRNIALKPMLIIQINVPLRQLNTFGIAAVAEHFTTIDSVSDLPELSAVQMPRHILGGGSNVLLTGNVGGLVIHNCIKGIELVSESEHFVYVKVGAGEIWHDFVMFAVERGWGGLENLALIPGTVGASPIQNIGAYGAEAKDTIVEVNGWDWAKREMVTMKAEDCQFGYRNSVFKNELKDKVLITSVVFRLSKVPAINTSYDALREKLESQNIHNPSVLDVAHAVIEIRQSKLPDPKVIGNAGSFFKNPVVALQVAGRIIDAYPHAPVRIGVDAAKIPAAWLIEQGGWKGYRKADAGVHQKQALVLVNYGTATGNEILALSQEIIASVKNKFDILLEREVNCW